MKRSLACAALLLLAAALPAAAVEPSATARYREAAMKALAAHFAALSAIAKGEVPHRGHAPAHAEAIGAVATSLPDLFPKETGAGQGEALPAIWQRPDEFDRAAAAFRSAAGRLVVAARSGKPEGLSAALAEVGRGCKGCHETFRARK